MKFSSVELAHPVQTAALELPISSGRFVFPAFLILQRNNFASQRLADMVMLDTSVRKGW